MSDEAVQMHNGLSVGAEVYYTPESGFDAGKPVKKIIKTIRLVGWTGEEQRRLGVPAVEQFIAFTDGTFASHYDNVQVV